MGPGGELLASGLHHPLTERQNQTGVFCHGDEVVGSHQAALGVLPAQQRFYAHDLAQAIHLRLVVHLELLLAQPHAQIGADGSAGAHRGLHGGVEKTDGVAPLRLGLIHCQVGLFEQFTDLALQAVENRHANAWRGKVLVARELKWVAQHIEHFFGQCARLLKRRFAVEPQIIGHDDEFVTTQARDGVGLAHALRQALGHMLQQMVADVVTQRVVDDLEMIQVYEHQRTVLTRAGAVCEGFLQPVEQQLAIRQIGQSVI